MRHRMINRPGLAGTNGIPLRSHRETESPVRQECSKRNYSRSRKRTPLYPDADASSDRRGNNYFPAIESLGANPPNARANSLSSRSNCRCRRCALKKLPMILCSVSPGRGGGGEQRGRPRARARKERVRNSRECNAVLHARAITVFLLTRLPRCVALPRFVRSGERKKEEEKKTERERERGRRKKMKSADEHEEHRGITALHDNARICRT